MLKRLRWSVAMVVAFGLLAFLFWLYGDPVNASNLARIRQGMSKQMVEAILGRGESSRLASYKWSETTGSATQWDGEGYSIIVWFDEAGTVTHKEGWKWYYRWAWQVPLRYKIRNLCLSSFWHS